MSKLPQGKLRQEFERAFRTGRIERIEQRTTGENGLTKHLDGQQNSDAR
ncbi:MAG: hypothetical protein M3R10_08695 [Verrucomicrobiota bacterium]|nr:hypothetical protein [Verrucomicrobiota bacterium]